MEVELMFAFRGYFLMWFGRLEALREITTLSMSQSEVEGNLKKQ
jgi:hypothetical protein